MRVFSCILKAPLFLFFMPYCSYEQCFRPAERNGKCATHNRLERKGPTKPIGKSESQTKQDSDIDKMYKLFDAATPHFCSNCGTPHQLQHSHILPRGQYRQHAANIINIVWDCPRCHYLWEHGTLEQVKEIKNYEYRLGVIMKLAPEYMFRRFGV